MDTNQEGANTKTGKPDRVFDMNELGAFSQKAFSSSNSNSILSEVINTLVNFVDTHKERDRYFYYTKDTASIARTGLAGSYAYRYSLNDPNADGRELTQDEINSLDALERFAYRYHTLYFWLGAVLLLSFAGYIGYQYTHYENLKPTLLIVPISVLGFFWIKILNTAGGASVERLPKNVIAFGPDPSLPPKTK